MDKKLFIEAVNRIKDVSLQKEDFSVRFEDSKLALITSAGQITGTLLGIDDVPGTEEFQSNGFDALECFFHSTAAQLITTFPDNNDFILLRDAIWEASGQRISYRYLYVLTDSVIAVTIVPANH